jgi:flagellar biosynthesis protein FliR
MLQLSFGNYILLLLVFARMSGALLFNPFFGRRNVPAIAKIGLAMLASILLTPVLQVPVPVFSSTVSLMLSLLKEMLVGFALGFLMNLFLSWVVIAGEVMDMEIGLGMARMYDPLSNVSMPIAGTMFNLMITLVFFSSNGHLTLIRIIASSCQLFPPGPAFFDFQAGSYLALMFGDMVVLALKLAMPVIATELLTEAGMGVLMRIVPQINVFVASLQVKIAIGLAIIIVALPAASRLMDDTLMQMYQRMQESLAVMLSGA